ncbi:hypothetical protein BDZ88DRAFT_395348, partial [Geranomyces variabilis]
MAFPGGIGEYMAVKRQKLFDQGHAFAAAGSQSAALAGINLYFNGYTGTTLSYLEFKELVLVHGALVRDKLEGDVTHIIATQMTSKKQKEILKPIVRPEWLTDSIAHGKLLPWRQYRLFTDVEASQRTFGAFAAADGATSTTARKPFVEPETSPPNPPPPPPPPPPLLPVDAELPEADEGDEASAWVRANICTAPNFLQRYFASSRLHHLTTWKNSLRDFVAVESARLGKRKARPQTGTRTIMHVDMDCFFASVAVRDRPDLRERPVAVAHSAGTAANRSTSEIASCNYAARKHGVKNGMSMGKARDRCKDLLVMPYEFEKYDKCSKALYKILLSHADDVQAVSIDEGYIDVSSSIAAAGAGQELDLAQKIRKEIFAATGCTASIGIGPNMLVARMATNKAKPDGAHLVPAGTEAEFMAAQSISDLPGVGFVLTEKLEQKHIETCEQLSAVSLSVLQWDYGEKTGSMLHRACRGIDARELENKPRQSVGAEINWGVRFETQEQVEKFLFDLTDEVVKRMKAISVKGRQVTVKVKRRRYEGEPAKVLGCGDCDNLSKSSALNGASDAVDLIFREAYRMLREQRAEPDYIRGIGVHVGKLEGGPVAQAAMEAGQKTLNFGSERAANQIAQAARAKSGADAPAALPQRSWSPRLKAPPVQFKLPTASQVDPEVFKALPLEMQKEI